MKMLAIMAGVLLLIPPVAHGAADVARQIQRLKSEDWRERSSAAVALEKLGPAAKDAVPALIAALGHEFSPPRLAAAQALGRIGPAAAEAAGALKEVLKGNEKGPVGRAAAAALRAIGPVSDKTSRETSVVPPASTDFGLIKRLKLDRDQRWALAGWLGWQWPVVEPAELVRFLYTIADEKQLGILKGMVASGAMPALPPAGGQAASQRPADTLGRTDKDIFLEVHPDAKRIALKQAGAETYTVLYQPKALVVFDKTGRAVYKRYMLGRSPDVYSRFEQPIFLAALGRVLAIPIDSGAPKIGWTSIHLVGFARDTYHELELDYSLSSSYPFDYHHPTWLEDIDKDGTPEICRFRHHNDPRPDDMRLKCLRWDAAKGKWQWLEEFASRRVARTHPPLRWLLPDATYDKKKQTVDLTLKITSLSDKPVRLSQPLMPLIRHYRSPEPDPQFPCPVILRPHTPERQKPWKLTPLKRHGKELKIAPGATVSLGFRLQVPEGQEVPKNFAVQLTGRVRWQRFECTYRIPEVFRLSSRAAQTEK